MVHEIPAEKLPVRCETNRQPLCWNSCTIHDLFVCRWFCVVHDPKPPLHGHNWLSLGKLQDTERFLIHCERHFSSRLPPSGGTWKYAKDPSIKKLGEILYLLICSFLPCVSWLLRSRVRKSRRDLLITLYIRAHYFNPCTVHLSLFCTMTNKCTIISQIITFVK